MFIRLPPKHLLSTLRNCRAGQHQKPACQLRQLEFRDARGSYTFSKDFSSDPNSFAEPISQRVRETKYDTTFIFQQFAGDNNFWYPVIVFGTSEKNQKTNIISYRSLWIWIWFSNLGPKNRGELGGKFIQTWDNPWNLRKPVMADFFLHQTCCLGWPGIHCTRKIDVFFL